MRNFEKYKDAVRRLGKGVFSLHIYILYLKDQELTSLELVVGKAAAKGEQLYCNEIKVMAASITKHHRVWELADDCI